MFRFLLATLLLGLTFNFALSASVAKPTCGGTTSSRTIQLLSPKNPPRECKYFINAYNSQVCQLRIDFTMTLAQPTVPGPENQLKHAKCLDDYFEIGGLRLCGVETQQHIYMPFNRTAGVTKINMQIVLAARSGWGNLPTPDWNIRITQLECSTGASKRRFGEIPQLNMFATNNDGFFVAPPGCLQYFPQELGAFTSFNFNNGAGIYPGELNYAICFRRTEVTKSLVLNSHFFKLGNAPLSLDNQCYPQKIKKETKMDFLMVPQATIEGTGMHATYFCGNSSSAVHLRSTHPGPLMVIFNSDGFYQPSEIGFAVSYQVV